jgi:hypothetical protein
MPMPTRQGRNDCRDLGIGIGIAIAIAIGSCLRWDDHFVH